MAKAKPTKSCAECGRALPKGQRKFCDKRCRDDHGKKGSNRGRPSDYTEKTVNEFLERIAEGETLVSICKDEHMPSAVTIFNWLRDERRGDFLKSYQLARMAQSDVLGDQILAIAEDESKDVLVDVVTTVKDEEETTREINKPNPVAVQRAKLRMEARAKLAKTYSPRKWGDFKVLEHQGEVAHVKRIVQDPNDFDDE